ncbi:MAG TPA: hypothetical protein VK469_20580 [Candidatus Kapabacteria bacterium]|nr:hypothetical protein [Candidatus Kapabacteria bacterium]
MKIAYVNDAILACGGIITNFEHCKYLRERGYDAFLVANGRNANLQSTYETVPVARMEVLEEFTDDDIIVANWWMQVSQLEKYKGRKIQFVQGADLKADYGDDLKKKCLETRQNPNWEIMAVSQYAGEWTGREFTIIPNGINERFFEKHNLERDTDALIVGNDEKLKNIDYSINEAKKDGHKKIVWMGRETHLVEGVECVTNPPQEEIPKIYQRSKHFYIHSLSEGFCLPLAEAIVSGCIIHAGDMGNKFDPDQDFRWEKQIDLLEKFYGANTKSQN